MSKTTNEKEIAETTDEHKDPQLSTEKQEEDVQQKSDDSQEATKKKRRPPVILITVVAIIIVAAAIYFVRPDFISNSLGTDFKPVTETQSDVSSAKDATEVKQVVSHHEAPSNNQPSNESPETVATATPLSEDNKVVSEPSAKEEALTTEAPAVPLNEENKASVDEKPTAVAPEAAEHKEQETKLIDENKKRIDELETSLNNLSSQLQSLKEENANLRDHLNLLNPNDESYSLGQITQLLTTAQNELSLTRNIETATKALEMALNLSKTSVAFSTLSKAIASDLVAIQTAKVDNVDALYQETQTLKDLLEKSVLLTYDGAAYTPPQEDSTSTTDAIKADYLLANEQTTQPENQEETPATPEKEPNWFERAWDEVASWWSSDMGGLVKVEKISTPYDQIIDEAQARAVRDSMKLEVQLAQQALVGAYSDIWVSSLDEIAKNLDRYYQHQDPNVQKAMALVRKLQETPVRPVLPKLDLSLDALAKTKEIIR
ncbi:uroporphyrinogen-III C-methyltransferase [Basilea psittacipulmonis]|uniref:Uroporphyrin-III methyltransferase n=1 Tax=Basilea psittacipulmonis DSM 24701 TaxID=1072685 RepID=A0A077DF67_9BURK|nr:uroporphyrinogen-III C-methyltransferase [Basilea psittacipulmonis]AIL32756.1 hypothetical protein IX83_05035 [Basilea psittacipulmonis DSM 24701]